MNFDIHNDGCYVLKDVYSHDLINQINHISYEELLDLDKVNKFNNIKVHNDNKILNISLN